MRIVFFTIIKGHPEMSCNIDKEAGCRDSDQAINTDKDSTTGICYFRARDLELSTLDSKVLLVSEGVASYLHGADPSARVLHRTQV